MAAFHENSRVQRETPAIVCFQAAVCEIELFRSSSLVQGKGFSRVSWNPKYLQCYLGNTIVGI
jgi:hypothetical protein